MKIRQATPDNLHDIVSVNLKSEHYMYQQFLPEDIIDKRSTTSFTTLWHAKLNLNKKCNILVSEKNNSIVGVIAYGVYSLKKPEKAFLHSLYVAPNHIGWGVGTQLFEEA